MFKKVLAGCSFIIGITLLASKVLWPFLESQSPIKTVGFFDPGTLISYRSGSVLGAFTKETVFGELAQTLPQSPSQSGVENFYLTVPKLKINHALVRANTRDLNPENFIGHLSGTALPGERGISFLYGHSVLPWFFEPTDYQTIFSNLHKLDFGDSFAIDLGGNLLSFEVVYKVTLEPEEVVPFMESDYFANSDSWVILMTCTPPGLDTKRILVIGKKR